MTDTTCFRFIYRLQMACVNANSPGATTPSIRRAYCPNYSTVNWRAWSNAESAAKRAPRMRLSRTSVWNCHNKTTDAIFKIVWTIILLASLYPTGIVPNASRNAMPLRNWTFPNCRRCWSSISRGTAWCLCNVYVSSNAITLMSFPLYCRFYADYQGGNITFQKRQSCIDFPLDEFDIREYLSPFERKTNRSTVYQLCGVSNHYGSMRSGHYTAFCKNSPTKQWVYPPRRLCYVHNEGTNGFDSVYLQMVQVRRPDGDPSGSKQYRESCSLHPVLLYNVSEANQ